MDVAPGIAAARFPERVEVAAYFCCMEVIGQSTGQVRLELSEDGSELVVSIRGASLDVHSRLAIADRVEACGGTVTDPGLSGGASLQARLPAGAL